MVTDEAGAVVRTVAYDPWGQARAAENWLAPLDPAVLDTLGLGFTGHPARLDADLVDMGGRSYHPRLGRFFSPDPLVVAPLDGQAYNRYAYVRNGPLGATDPSGYGEQGLGSDDGDAGKGAPLGPDCSDPRGCVPLECSLDIQACDGLEFHCGINDSTVECAIIQADPPVLVPSGSDCQCGVAGCS